MPLPHLANALKSQGRDAFHRLKSDSGSRASAFIIRNPAAARRNPKAENPPQINAPNVSPSPMLIKRMPGLAPQTFLYTSYVARMG